MEALAEAVWLGQLAPEELAGALGRVIPISAELGVSFQETTGLIAALTKGGLSASEAVTGIRGAMQAFIKPTEEAKKMMEQYGLTSEGVLRVSSRMVSSAPSLSCVRLLVIIRRTSLRSSVPLRVLALSFL